MRGRFEEIIGKQFNRLTVLGFEYVKNYDRYYKCLCKCGNIKTIMGTHVRCGRIVSCGCFKKEIEVTQCKLNAKKNFKGLNDISGDYFTKLKRGAEKRTIDFNISLKDIWDKYILQNRKCALSGVDIEFSPIYGRGYSVFQTASVDRILPHIDYYPDNIQIIHKDIQSMKWEMPEDKLFAFISLIFDPINLSDIFNEKTIQDDREYFYNGIKTKFSKIKSNAKTRKKYSRFL